ncbi:MAG: hypothetical protein AB4042_04280 [Leptolyngbyaceae cyanobacterium]
MSQTPKSAAKKVLLPLGCCLGCAGIVVGLPILLVVIAYGVIFHTAIPLRLVLNLAETDATMQFNGVSGSITKGFTIEEWVIKGQNGVDDSRVEDLTFRYNGILDVLQNQRLIIDEISVAKVDVVVGPDFFTPAAPPPRDDSSATDEETPDEDTDSSTDPDSTSPDGEAVEVDFEFQLQTLDLQNVRMRSSDAQFELAIPQVTLVAMQFKDQAFSLQSLDINDFQLRLPNVGPASTPENPDAVDLAIPQIHLAGLAIAGDRFNLAELDVTSNFVSFALEEAQPQTINGEVIPYSRRLRGQVSPTINEVILRPFDFTIDFAVLDDGAASLPGEFHIINRFVGFGGALEQVTFPSGGAFIRTKAFSPSDYFALKSDLVPERCSLLSVSQPAPAGAADQSGQSTIQGDCYWGATQFTLSPQSEETLVAKAQVRDHAITLRMKGNQQAWIPMLEFTAEPTLPLPDILALVYFQKSYAQLSAGERSRINTIEAELR